MLASITATRIKRAAAAHLHSGSTFLNSTDTQVGRTRSHSTTRKEQTMKIGFVAVFVTDFDRSLDFYAKTLGMEIDYTDKQAGPNSNQAKM